MLEACGAAHHWARILTGLGHDVKLIAPEAVKPFVKKGKKCVSNAPVQYGATSLTVPGAGKYKLRIKPSGQALAALQRGKTLKVKATILFTPKGIVSPFVHVVNVKVHLKKAKKKHGGRKTHG